MRAARAWLRGHPTVVDAVAAAGVFSLGVLSVRIFYDLGAASPPNFRFATGVMLMALLTLPLALRRRRPPVTLACVAAAVVGCTVFGVTERAITSTVAFVAIYSVGANCPPRLANWARGTCIAAMSAALGWMLLFREIRLGESAASAVGAGILSVGSNLFFFIAAWVIGDVARSARLRAVEVAASTRELHAAQRVIADQAVLDERVRIARELHDVVAHHVSVMGVQAGAARRVMVRSPEQAAAVLSGIEEESRRAVVELQRLLGFLRREPRVPLQGSVAAPLPGLSGLDAMVAQLNDAGLVVTVERRGTPGALPASVDLSSYRIVQEALTNALKHGGAGTIAAVTLTYDDESLQLEIVDDGRGRSNGRADLPRAPAVVTGHGLLGMRERVALHGGRFLAERRRGSGFRVSASLPLPPSRR